MRTRTLEYLCCPVCREHSLHIKDSVLARRDSGDGEIIEGTLACATCNYSTVIVLGVALLVANYQDYLTRNKGTILQCEHICMASTAVIEIIRSMPESPYGAIRSETWETPIGIESYINGQYGLNAGGSFYRYIVDLVSATASKKRSSTGILVDLGSNVGGCAARLAPLFQYSIGVDMSFLATLEARRINLGAPTKRSFLSIPVSSTSFVNEVHSMPDVASLDFIVADAFQLPILMSSIDLALMINLIDIVHSPMHLLEVICTALADNSRILVATPYYFRVDRNPPSSWQSLQQVGVGHTLARMGMLVTHESQKEWIIDFYQRYQQHWQCDVVLGVKQRSN